MFQIAKGMMNGAPLAQRRLRARVLPQPPQVREGGASD